MDTDDDQRPILCGQLVTWLHGAPGTLMAGQLVSETINVDGWTLAHFATQIYDLVRAHTA